MAISNVTQTTQNSWLYTIQADHALLRGRSYLTAKRVMDIALVLVTAPVTLPLFVLVYLLMKLESRRAPVFFTQLRTGQGGKRFKLYKFRTMVVNAEEMKKELAHLNELQWPDFKITNDPRVTRVGRILRKTSLDELPQLWNILIGDMSFVGPRPTSFSAETYALWHTERLDVKPGLTGLWQITGRASTEFDERLRLDIAYMERRCLWLDIQILVRTFTAVLEQRGAH
jgi:lipopolysaccharide/colanic/teichoic acid biosynthesis glycosyltransferase